MFKELYPLIRRTTLHILLSTEGDLLRVNITPKAIEGENPALATPISLLATPEELDAELSTILAGYTDAHMDLRASLEIAKTAMTEGKPAAKPAEKAKPEKPKGKGKVPTEPAKPSDPDEPEAAVAPSSESSTAETAPEPAQPAELEAVIEAAPEDQTATSEDTATPAAEPIVEPEQPEESATHTEAAPPMPVEEAPEDEAPAPEKDENTIELF